MRTHRTLALAAAAAILSLSRPALGEGDGGEKESVLKKLEKLTKGESLTVEGKAFVRYWVTIQDAEVEPAGEGEAHDNSFELWRFYFGIRSKLTPWLSMRFTADVGPEKKDDKTAEAEGHVHGFSGDQSYQLYVKYAWFQANFHPDFALRAGVVDNPWNEFTDSFWGYRHVAKNLGDEQKLWNSADLGAYLSWKIPKKLGEITLGVANGAGYKKAVDTNVNTAWASDDDDPETQEPEKDIRFLLSSQVEY